MHGFAAPDTIKAKHRFTTILIILVFLTLTLDCSLTILKSPGGMLQERHCWAPQHSNKPDPKQPSGTRAVIEALGTQ